MMNNLKMTTIPLIIALSACSTAAEQNLQSRVERYQSCYIEEDYTCMASLMLPALVEQAGGAENMVQLIGIVKEQTALSGIVAEDNKMEFSSPGEIHQSNDVMISVVPTKLPITYHDKNGLITSSVIAFSEDNGESWFFMEGTDESRMAIADSSPDLLQKVDIPTPTLTIDDMVLKQKNGHWVK